MKKRVFIAEPREVVRAGLCNIFQREAAVSEVNDAATHEELQIHLSSQEVDLVVVSQGLVTDMELLPQGKFILLADEPDLNMLERAYEHQARGYFSINITANLLKAALYATGGNFLVDPTLLPWMIELISESRKRSNELQLLSPREREVITLLHEGLDRHTIARQLYISEATLKTHIRNIARKQEDLQWSQSMHVYERSLKDS